MNNEEQATNVVEQQVETPATTSADTQQEQVVGAEQPRERLYTKAEVQNLMRQRVNRSHQAFFDRYKVKDLGELDNVFGSYNDMKNEYSNMQLKLNEVNQLNAFLRNNIEPNRYDDIKTYFKGNELEFSEDELIKALATHPEWLKPSNIPSVPTTTIKTLGSEGAEQRGETEEAKMQRIFGKI